MQIAATTRPGTTPSLRMRARAFALAWLAFLAWIPSGAHADLMLYPTRVVFERNARAAQVELVNNGQAAETYRISLVNRRMNETGEFSAAEPPLPDERFAAEMLRYSPRQVVVPAGGSQTIRLLLRKPANLPAGEYRSHLQFDLVPEATGAASLDAAAPATAPGEVGVQLRALLAVSIPVIVRQGDTSAEVRLSGVRLERPTPETPFVAAVIERNGNRSVYGDLVATVVEPGGNAREVGRASGIAVYTPNASRRVRLPVQPAAASLLRPGATLRLSYDQRPEEGGKPLAQSAVQLP